MPNYIPRAERRKNPVTPVDARTKSLGLQSPWDLYRKLAWEIDIFTALDGERRIPLSDDPSSPDPFRHMYAAINAACTVWALTEWFWMVVQKNAEVRSMAEEFFGIENMKSRAEFQEHLRTDIEDFDVCYQICHAFKHVIFDRKNTDTMGLHADARFVIRQVGNRPPTIEVVAAIGDPKKHRDDDALKHLFERRLGFWHYLLTKCNVPDAY